MKKPKVTIDYGTDSYESPDGRHRHECGVCGCVWEHSDDERGVDAAHHCPECGPDAGTHGWWYHGDKAPQYHDHHKKRKRSGVKSNEG